MQERDYCVGLACSLRYSLRMVIDSVHTYTIRGIQRPPVQKTFCRYNISTVYFVDDSCVRHVADMLDSPGLNSVRSVSVNGHRADGNRGGTENRESDFFDSDQEILR